VKFKRVRINLGIWCGSKVRPFAKNPSSMAGRKLRPRDPWPTCLNRECPCLNCCARRADPLPFRPCSNKTSVSHEPYSGLGRPYTTFRDRKPCGARTQTMWRLTTVAGFGICKCLSKRWPRAESNHRHKDFQFYRVILVFKAINILPMLAITQPGQIDHKRRSAPVIEAHFQHTRLTAFLESLSNVSALVICTFAMRHDGTVRRPDAVFAMPATNPILFVQ